jgi:hypothetical protein
VRPVDRHEHVTSYAQRPARPSFHEVMKLAAPYLAKMGG